MTRTAELTSRSALGTVKWSRKCPKCNAEILHTSKRQAVYSNKRNKLCRTCCNRSNTRKLELWHRSIRIGWFNKIRASAKYRRIEWKLTLDDVADVMDKQGGKCAYTGVDISFTRGSYRGVEASIDRIDSARPYERGNIQIVCKSVNWMKHKLSHSKFLELCKLVVENCDEM